MVEKNPTAKDSKNTDKKAKDTTKSQAESGKIVKLNKMPILVGGIVAAVLVIVMVILAFTVGKPTEEKDDQKVDENGGNSQVDEKEENEAVVLDKTLTVGKLSMKYPSKEWKLNDSEIDGADGTAGISKGNNNYVLLTTVESEAGLTTKEFADSSMSSYKTSGFVTTEALAAVKINGKEWYKARMYGQGAYATVLFNANGNNYYIATFASVSKDESKEVKQMIDTLTVK